MPQQIIPVAEWRPDMPSLANATDIAVNVIPATEASYGPLQSLAPYSSNAMDGLCIGAVAVQSSDLTVAIFGGTADKLYEITATSTAWQDISGETYTTAPGDNWRFALFDYSVIATNFGNEIQSFKLGSSPAFGPLFTAPAWVQNTTYSTVGEYVLANGMRYVLVTPGTSDNTGTGPSGTGAGITDGTAVWNYQSSAPPQARFLCTPKNFLFVANTFDPVGGNGPLRAWWSANGDATSWPAPGSNPAIEGMSDFNDFQGLFGEITGTVDSLANADVAIFFRHAVWRGLFVGPPDVFDFFPTENVRGCPCPNGIVPIGALVYYPGEDGLYVFDGASSQPIGADKFDKWFWSTVNQGFLDNVVGAADVVNKAVIWIFPSTAASDGIPDTVLVYRWDIQRASYATLGPSAIAWICRLLTLGVTLDGFYGLGFTELDTIPASLDSRVWIGGALTLGGVDGTGHLTFFSGPNMAASVATNTVQLTSGRRTFFQSARPLVDLTVGTPTISVSARVNLYDPVVFGPAVSPNVAGECPQRADGRYHEAMIALPAGATWTHIQGVDSTFAPGGLR